MNESEQFDYISDRETKSGKTVAFYSLEMESSEIYERLLSKRSKIPMNTLIERGARAGNSRSEKDKESGFSARDLEFLQKKINELSALSIKINDNPACRVNNIRLESRLIKNLGLIVIDYLQLERVHIKISHKNNPIFSILDVHKVGIII